MNGYAKRTIKKRQDIIEAAQALFLTNGIVGVTIEQIAERARVSRVTLFKYFGDKGNLVKEVVLVWVTVLMQEFDRILESNLPFHNKVTKILDLRIDNTHFTDDETLRKAVRGNAELMSIVKEQVATRGLPKIIALIEEGKLAGEIDPSLDNEAILTYFSIFSPVVSDPSYIQKKPSYQSSLFNMFMGGLLKNWHKGGMADGFERE